MAAGSDNPSRFEIEGRADKCWRIARWALGQGFTHADAADWSQEQWEHVASQVGVNPPSSTSRGQVVGYMTTNPLWTPKREARN